MTIKPKQPAGKMPESCPHGVSYRWNCEKCDEFAYGKPAVTISPLGRELSNAAPQKGSTHGAGTAPVAVSSTLNCEEVPSAGAAPVAELIARLRASNSAGNLCDEAADALAAMEQKNAALRDDAERYRFVRKVNAFAIVEYCGMFGPKELKGKKLDKAIDAAREKTRKK